MTAHVSHAIHTGGKMLRRFDRNWIAAEGNWFARATRVRRDEK